MLDTSWRKMQFPFKLGLGPGTGSFFFSIFKKYLAELISSARCMKCDSNAPRPQCRITAFLTAVVMRVSLLFFRECRRVDSFLSHWNIPPSRKEGSRAPSKAQGICGGHSGYYNELDSFFAVFKRVTIWEGSVSWQSLLRSCNLKMGFNVTL